MSDAGTAEMGSDTIPVLWLDDMPETIEIIATLVTEERIPLAIDVVRTLDVARAKIDTGEYCALVVDCLLEEEGSEDRNGAEFLLEVNESLPYLPTFVYSGFRKDARFLDYLQRAQPVYSTDRATVNWQRPIAGIELIAQLREYATAYHDVKHFNPEKISYSAFMKAPKTYERETRAHWVKHRIWIQRELRDRGWAWGVACGLGLVKGSADIFDFPDEAELKVLGKQHNLIPFAYSVPILPETVERHDRGAVQWNEVRNPNDRYATLRIKIGNRLLVEDFDTGAEQTHVARELVERGLLDFARSSEKLSHLGQPYEFFTKKIPVTLLANDGTEMEHKLTVSVVRNWTTSPFTKVNNERQVLVGRDVLRAFPVYITLDSRRCTTQLEFIGEL